jgi:hypothetical protein
VTERYATQVLNYGGGRQTVATCILIASGELERPDRIVISDTGREAQSTWDYADQHVRPLLESVGLRLEVAPHSLATVDLYSHKGTLLLPVFTPTGKFSAYCSSEWKRDVMRRYLRNSGVNSATNWIGYSYDERRRWEGRRETDGPWRERYPLVERMLTKADCVRIIRKAGKPLPPKSACFLCPHRMNSEWRFIRDNYPEQWEEACRTDEEIREDDDQHAVYLHEDRVPLREANLDGPDRKGPSRQCSLGMCFV